MLLTLRRKEKASRSRSMRKWIRGTFISVITLTAGIALFVINSTVLFTSMVLTAVLTIAVVKLNLGWKARFLLCASILILAAQAFHSAISILLLLLSGLSVYGFFKTFRLTRLRSTSC